MTTANTTHQLDAKLVSAIINSAVEVMSTMAGMETKLKEAKAQLDYTPTGDISGVIGILGDKGEGMVAISFPLVLANKLVASLLGMNPNAMSSDMRADGIGELVNIISGKIKATLSNSMNTVYKLSLPTVIMGANHEVASRPQNNPYLILAFEAEGHVFHMQVSFKSYD